MNEWEGEMELSLRIAPQKIFLLLLLRFTGIFLTQSKFMSQSQCISILIKKSCSYIYRVDSYIKFRVYVRVRVCEIA